MVVEDDKPYLVAFATVPGIGASRLNLLIKYFGSAEKAWKSSEEEMMKVGLPKDVLLVLLEQKKKLNVHEYFANLDKRGIKVLTIKDPDYPERLRNIPSAPQVLFVKSQLTNQQINQLTLRKIIGVVGTRKVTDYGREVTENLTTALVANGFTIVSGMALGVDGVAHGACLNAGGTTIAVLGAGVDIIYPRQHKDLYNSILEHGGAVISEVAPEKTVIRGIFPARNRIISGLSEAVLVTEGAIDSGSLITARAALDQGREVFAVPGPINSAMAEGTNYLLKQGAKLVTDVSDILSELGYEENKSVTQSPSNPIKDSKGDSDEEQKIIDLLVREPMEFDELIRRTGYKAAELGAVLSTLEIKGKVRNQGLRYRL